MYTYAVKFHTRSDIEEIYVGTDEEAAIDEYTSFTLNDIELDNTANRTDMLLMLEVKEDTYRYVYEDDDSDISEWEIEEFYDDDTIYELIDEGEFEEVRSRTIDPLNKTSDKLLDSIQQHYSYEYGSWKYNRIEVLDDSGHEVGCIRLRIADHTENIINFRNRDACDGFISVVIGNINPTKSKFGMRRNHNEIHLEYTSEHGKDDIISDVDAAIEQLKLDIIEDNITECYELNLSSIINKIPNLNENTNLVIDITKNTDAAPDMGGRYGQDVEPKGTYVVHGKSNIKGYVNGKAKLNNPLYIEVDENNLIEYKRELAKKYKARGKQLTDKLMDLGYDAIVTVYENGDYGEIVLFPNSSFMLN